jgi:hypothetical protein
MGPWVVYVAVAVGWGKLPPVDRPAEVYITDGPADFWKGMPHAAGAWAQSQGKVATATLYLQTRNVTAEEDNMVADACAGIADKAWCRNRVLPKFRKKHPPDGGPLQLEMLKLFEVNIRARHSSTFGQRYASGRLPRARRPQQSSVQGHPVRLEVTRVQGHRDMLLWDDREAVIKRHNIQGIADQMWNFVAWDVVTNSTAVLDVSRTSTYNIHTSPLVVTQFSSMPTCTLESDKSKWPALDRQYTTWHEPAELKPRLPSTSEYRFNLSWTIAIHRCAHDVADHFPDTRALLANIIYHQALVGIKWLIRSLERTDLNSPLPHVCRGLSTAISTCT